MNTKEMLKISNSYIESKNLNTKKEQEQKEEKNVYKKYDYNLNKIKKINEKYEIWYNENYSK